LKNKAKPSSNLLFHAPVEAATSHQPSAISQDCQQQKQGEAIAKKK